MVSCHEECPCRKYKICTLVEKSALPKAECWAGLVWAGLVLDGPSIFSLNVPLASHEVTFFLLLGRRAAPSSPSTKWFFSIWCCLKLSGLFL